MGVIGDPLFALNFVDAAPDAETVRLLQKLDPGAADRYECLAVMEVTNRLIAAMQGMQLAAMGRFITQYDPLARRYAAAEVACIFPNHNRPARTRELDHTIPPPNDPTSADNLKPLCKFHHKCKTHHG